MKFLRYQKYGWRNQDSCQRHMSQSIPMDARQGGIVHVRHLRKGSPAYVYLIVHYRLRANTFAS